MGQCRDMPRSDRSGHDDVIVIPEFACKMGDWDAYYALLREIRASRWQFSQSIVWAMRVYPGAALQPFQTRLGTEARQDNRVMAWSQSGSPGMKVRVAAG